MVNLQFTYEELVAALGSIWALYKALCYIADRYNIGQKRKESKLLKQANMNMMKEIIRLEHKDFMRQGWVDSDELEHIERVYELYHELGGNGSGTRMMEDLRKLPRQMDKTN